MSSLAKHLLLTGLTSVGVVSVSLGTGVLVARALGPAGRGEIAALLALAQLIGWIAALGTPEALIYLAARHPEERPEVVATGLCLALALGTLGFVLAQVVLPYALSAQEPRLLVIGRVFMLAIYLHVGSSILSALAGGRQDFSGVNLLRILQPTVYLALLVALLVAGRLEVSTVLGAAAVSNAVATAWIFRRLRRSQVFGRPSMGVLKAAGRFALRVQGSLLGNLGTARLDLAIMPAVLGPAAIGLYSVATNASSVLVSLVGALDQVVYPAAAYRGPQEGMVVVTKVLRLVLVAGLLFALPLLAAAPDLLSLIYGPRFAAAAPALRILAVAVLFQLAAGTLDTGLQAVNRPLAASATQLVGLAVTVVGLLALLEPLGINGAAWTTLVAGCCSFLAGLYLVEQEERFSWRHSLSPRAFRDDLSAAVARLRRS